IGSEEMGKTLPAVMMNSEGAAGAAPGPAPAPAPAAAGAPAGAGATPGAAATQGAAAHARRRVPPPTVRAASRTREAARVTLDRLHVPVGELRRRDTTSPRFRRGCQGRPLRWYRRRLLPTAPPTRAVSRGQDRAKRASCSVSRSDDNGLLSHRAR